MLSPSEGGVFPAHRASLFTFCRGEGREAAGERGGVCDVKAHTTAVAIAWAKMKIAAASRDDCTRGEVKEAKKDE